MDLTLDSFIAHARCPLGAMNEMKLRHPGGEPEVGAKILRKWPEADYPFGKVTSDTGSAAEWMNQTAFGMSEGAVSPPPAREGLGYGFWTYDEYQPRRRLLGRYEIGSTEVRFNVPWIHKPGRLWEIILLDTSPEPPGAERLSRLILWGSFITGAFEAMTGQGATCVLLSPAYREERRLGEHPFPFAAFATSWPALSQEPVPQAGTHCQEVRRVRHSKYEYACPLKERGKCPGLSRTG